VRFKKKSQVQDFVLYEKHYESIYRSPMLQRIA